MCLYFIKKAIAPSICITIMIIKANATENLLGDRNPENFTGTVSFDLPQNLGVRHCYYLLLPIWKVRFRELMNLPKET